MAAHESLWHLEGNAAREAAAQPAQTDSAVNCRSPLARSAARQEVDRRIQYTRLLGWQLRVRETTGLSERLVAPADDVYDLGANVGFYRLLASVLVGAHGHVFCFEPLPANVAVLKRHIEINRLTNCTVLPFAVSASDGEAR
jgi:hypothetical protein